MNRLLSPNTNICGVLVTHMISVLVIVAGCSTTTQVVQPDPYTGYFPTKTKLGPKNFKSRKTVDLQAFRSLLYIRKSFCGGQKCNKFIKESLENLGYFKSIEDKQEVQQMIVAEGLVDSIYDVSDDLILQWLRNRTGNFLIMDYSVEPAGSYNWVFDVQVINPQDAQILLHISHKGFNFAGLDEPLFYPVFNGIKDWIVENKNQQ